MNKEAIEINQDYQAEPGDAQPGCNSDEESGSTGATGEVWVRRLTDGSMAVALPNTGSEDAELSVCLDSLKWPHGNTASARDVWGKKDLGVFASKFTQKVAKHDTLLLRLSPTAAAN